MSNLEGKSASPPLRKRKSKRFDRTKQQSQKADSADRADEAGEGEQVDPEIVVESDTAVNPKADAKAESSSDDTATIDDADEVTDNESEDAAPQDGETSDTETDDNADNGDSGDTGDSSGTGDSSDDPDSADNEASDGDESGGETTVPIGESAADDSAAAVLAGGPLRTKTLDERATCGRCGHEVSMVNISVDGNMLVMESCDNCDSRRWHLAGEPIDLQQALDHVGEHAGRRR